MLLDRRMKQKAPEKTRFFNIYTFEENGETYKVAVTKMRANKRTHIVCDQQVISWEQIYPARYSPKTVKTMLVHTSLLLEKGKHCFVVVKGHPGMICGLDEGVFACSRAWSKDADKKKLYVMSAKAWSKLKKNI